MDIEKQKNIGRKIGLFVLLFWILVCLSVATYLYINNKYFEMTGWIIVSVLLLIMGGWSLIPARKPIILSTGTEKRITNVPGINVSGKDAMDLVMLLSTKDCVLVYAIINALEQNNINCVVLDKHSAQLMRFLPDVEMRIMVSVKDYEKGVKLVESLTKPDRSR